VQKKSNSVVSESSAVSLSRKDWRNQMS